jgi:hypothetical protein
VVVIFSSFSSLFGFVFLVVEFSLIFNMLCSCVGVCSAVGRD